MALAMALLMTAAVAEAQTKVNPGFNLFSSEQDVQIGQQSAAEAERQLPILNDSQVTGYVDTIGQRLARNAGGPAFQYRFRVVNASDINAFALPGGFIYVNRGVLEQAHSEGEVAGVLAHEISHVALRHGTHQASKAYLAQTGIGILGGILSGGKGGGTANIINAIGGLGLNALFLKYSRDLETQADVRGAQILAASGYAPAEMVNFFRTLESVDTAKKTNWLSDHPAPPDRVARITREAQMLHVAGNATTSVGGLQSIQARLRGAGGAGNSPQIAQRPAGTSRRRGPGTPATVNVAAPSSSYQTYTSPSRVYQVAYPSNWQVYQQGSTGVTLAPQGGIGSGNGQTDIVYGAIINHYDPFGGGSHLRGGTATLPEATSDLLAALTQSSPHLRVTQQASLGSNARQATLRGVDPGTGIDERVTVVTRQLSDDHLIYMLFITPEAEAARYRPVLNQMVGSLRVSTGTQH
jgi:Zn-dependent protease with chaperone function